MKIILVLTLLFFLSSWKNNAPNENSKSSLRYSFVEVGETYTICKVTNGSAKWYETVASIATAILPETVQGICLLSVKNPAICSAVYAATKRLVENNYNETKSGITEGIKFIASKGSNPKQNRGSTSRATIITGSREDAQKVGFVFNEYKRITCVRWGSVNMKDGSSCPSFNSNSYIALYNANGYEGSALRTKNFLEQKFGSYDFVVFQSWRKQRNDYAKTKIIYKKGYKDLALRIGKALPGVQVLSADESNDKYVLRHTIKVAIFVGRDNVL